MPIDTWPHAHGYTVQCMLITVHVPINTWPLSRGYIVSYSAISMAMLIFNSVVPMTAQGLDFTVSKTLPGFDLAVSMTLLNLAQWCQRYLRVLTILGVPTNTTRF